MERLRRTPARARNHARAECPRSWPLQSQERLWRRTGLRSRAGQRPADGDHVDRKSTRLNSSHTVISYAVFCLKKKNHNTEKNILSPEMEFNEDQPASFAMIKP